MINPERRQLGDMKEKIEKIEKIENEALIKWNYCKLFILRQNA